MTDWTTNGSDPLLAASYTPSSSRCRVVRFGPNGNEGPRIRAYPVETCSERGTLTGGSISSAAATFRGFALIQPPGTEMVASRKQIQIGFSVPNADSVKL